MTNKYKIERAEKFTVDEIFFIKETVLAAGEVDGNAFDGILTKNPILILYPNVDNVKAVGALKIPNDSYKRKVFSKSKTNRKPDEFEFELGWVVSLEKGNGKAMTKILSEYKPNIYTTVRDENERMIHIITRFGFIKIGESYKSVRGDYTLGLYIKSTGIGA